MRHSDQPTTEVELHIDAPPERVWTLVTDLEQLVSMSEELQAAEWIEADGPELGARFVATNTNRYFGSWKTTSTVIEYDEPRVFGWAVGDVDEPNTTWVFRLQADELGGTWLTQWMRLGIGDSGLGVAIARMPDKEDRIVAGRLREFEAAMRKNLDGVKALAEAADE
jgi:uncharacterized protein YndB with AHSA1/START domain